MRTSRSPYITLAVLLLVLLVTVVGVTVSTASHIDLQPVMRSSTSGLTKEESAYYQYVAPRLDRLVSEVDDVVVMVDGKSRDIIALSVSGARIEQLADEIMTYGNDHGVPRRFADIHARIVDATNTATFTFGQARQALRSFDFSGMTGLVGEFQAAAEALHQAQDALRAYGDGKEDA